MPGPAGAADHAMEQALLAQLPPHTYLDAWRCRNAPAADASALPSPAPEGTAAAAPSPAQAESNSASPGADSPPPGASGVAAADEPVQTAQAKQAARPKPVPPPRSGEQRKAALERPASGTLSWRAPGRAAGSSADARGAAGPGTERPCGGKDAGQDRADGVAGHPHGQSQPADDPGGHRRRLPGRSAQRDTKGAAGERRRRCAAEVPRPEGDEDQVAVRPLCTQSRTTLVTTGGHNTPAPRSSSVTRPASFPFHGPAGRGRGGEELVIGLGEAPGRDGGSPPHPPVDLDGGPGDPRGVALAETADEPADDLLRPGDRELRPGEPAGLLDDLGGHLRCAHAL